MAPPCTRSLSSSGPWAGKALKGIGMESNNIRDALQAADKNVGTFVEFDTGSLPLVNHGVHGFTPIVSRNFRASSTWYGLASLAGCGRWNVPTVVPCTKRTRERLTSTTSHPTAISSDSIRAHSTFAMCWSGKNRFQCFVLLAVHDSNYG